MKNYFNYRHANLLVVCLALAIGGAACHRTMDAAATLAVAQEQADKGNYFQAINQAKAALAKDDKNVAARLLMAKLLLKSTDVDGAQQALDQAIKLGATDQQIGELKYEILIARRQYQAILDTVDKETSLAAAIRLKFKALALAGSGNVDGALQTIDEAAKAAPDDLKILLAQSKLNIEAGRSAEARRVVDAVLAKDDKLAEAWLVKASLLFQERNGTEAHDALKKALAADKGQLDIGANIRLRAAIVDLALQMNKKDDVEVGLKELAARAPNAPVTLYLRARSDMLNNNPKEAVSNLEKALQAAPDHVPSRLLLGAALIAQGAPERAEAELSRLLSDHPESVEARKLLARVYLASNRAQDARKILSEAPQSAAADSQVEYLLGAALLSTGDRRGGIAHLEKSAADPTADANRKLDLATAYIADGERDKAIALLDSMPADAKSSRRSGLRLLAEIIGKDRKQAVEEIDKLLARNADDASMYEIGGAFFARVGNVAHARELFGKAIALAPKGVSARQRLALLDQALGDFASAEKDLAGILEVDPKSEFAHMTLAKIALQKNDQAKARKELESVIGMHPESIEGRLLLAQLSFAEKNATQAQSLLDQAATVSNRKPAVLNAIGEILLRAGKQEEALERFKEAANGGFIEAQFNIARVSANAGRLGEARRALETVVAKKVNLPAALTMLAELDLKEGHVEAALGRAEEIKKSSLSPAVIAETQGDIYALAKKYDKALAAYEAAYKAQPSQRLVIKEFDARRQGKLPNVTSSLTAWLEHNPNDVTVWGALGQYQLASGNNIAAIGSYERGIAASPAPNVVLMNNLAWLYNETGDKRALPLAQRAFELAPASSSVADTYGWVLIANGKFSDAEQVLSKAVAGDQSNPEIKYHLAVAQSRSGKNDQAATTLKELLAANVQFQARDKAEQLLKSVSR